MSRNFVVVPQRFSAERALGVAIAEAYCAELFEFPVVGADFAPLAAKVKAVRFGAFICFVGTFFSQFASEMATGPAQAISLVFYFNEKPEHLPGVAFHLCTPEMLGHFFVHLREHSDLLRLFIDRVVHPESDADQAAMVGFKHMMDDGDSADEDDDLPRFLSLDDVVRRVLQKKLLLEDVRNNGSVILAAQSMVVKERVAVNSFVAEIRDHPGVVGACVEATEYFVLTHAELHRVYPEAPLTVVWSLRPKTQGSRVPSDLVYKWPIRGYREDIDVGKIAAALDGDGNKRVGGGSSAAPAFALPFAIQSKTQ